MDNLTFLIIVILGIVPAFTLIGGICSCFWKTNIKDETDDKHRITF